LAAVFALAFAGLIAIPLATTGTAYAADTPTIDCDQASQGNNQQERNDWATCQQLTGSAACVWNNQNGSYTIALGYKNPTSSNLFAAIPVNGVGGTNNKLTATNGTASDPDHLSTFWANDTSVTAFTVTWYPSSRRDPVTWALMGHTYQFTERSAPPCTTKPVPIMGSMSAVGAGLGLLFVAFVFVNRRQLRRLRRTPWLHNS
jgi:hypothetical protein